MSKDIRADDYLNLCALHGLLPGHLFPTRNNSCLDHILLKTDKAANSFVLDSLFTDHNPIIVCCDIHIKKITKIRTSFHIDKSAIIADIRKTDFSDVLTSADPEYSANKLVSIISSTIKKHTRQVSVSSKRRILKPWITPGLLRCIRNRDKLYRKVKKDPNNIDLQSSYNRYKNFCNNLLKKIKINYESDEFFKARKDSKKTWDLIKQFGNLPNKKANMSSHLLKSANDAHEAVNGVNNFFANIGREIASKVILPSVKYKEYIKIPNSQFMSTSMVINDTDESEIRYIIGQLKDNCAVGWDGISTSILKATVDVLTPPLTGLFNLCLSKGIFPRVFKKAIIYPIYKNGDSESVNNYRPISILSSLSKILEKIIYKRLISFLDKYKVLEDNQYGFRANRSTEDALMKLVNTAVQHIDKKMKTVGIFLDLSKAFDTVSIPLLLSKLEKNGIRGTVYDLFKSYLSERTQCVSINNIISSDQNISFGVPQGSVLGPVLFLIYINDLCKLQIPNCKIITYADDTALIVNGNTWSDARKHSEKALTTIINWLSCNILTLNIEKTKFITFGHKSQIPHESYSIIAHKCPDQGYFCDCCPLSRSRTIKYLGVTLDENLTWTEHINATVSRLRKLIYVFRKLRSSATQKILKIVYISLVQSILNYCIPAWGGTSKCTMLRLERAQRCILKVMTHKPRRFSTTDLYTVCNVLSVRQLFILQAILRKHKKIFYNPDSVTLKRRDDKVCQIEHRRLASSNKQYYYLCPSLYNKVNEKIRIHRLTLRRCKIELKNWLLTLNYDDTENLIRILTI